MSQLKTFDTCGNYATPVCPFFDDWKKENSGIFPQGIYPKVPEVSKESIRAMNEKCNNCDKWE